MAIDPAWEVSVQDVHRMLDAKDNFLLIDVREPSEHARVNIEGARLVPLSQLPTRVDELKNEGRPIVAHCHHGGRSMQAAQFLRSKGIADVKSMAGGIDTWSVEIDPSKPRY